MSNVVMPNERDWAEDFDDENGQYMNRCYACNDEFLGHKRRVICKKCDTDGKERLRNEGFVDASRIHGKEITQLRADLASCRERLAAAEVIMTKYLTRLNTSFDKALKEYLDKYGERE